MRVFSIVHGLLAIYGPNDRCMRRCKRPKKSRLYKRAKEVQETIRVCVRARGRVAESECGQGQGHGHRARVTGEQASVRTSVWLEFVK